MMRDDVLTLRSQLTPPPQWQEPRVPTAAAVDHGLVRKIRDAVNGELSQWAITLERSPSAVEQRRRAEDLVTRWLEQQMLSNVASGVAYLSAAQEQVLRAAVLAEMFGLGRLEVLLAEPDVEDIYINGSQPVMVKLADGRREWREPIAATETDLMRQLESIATHHGNTSRSVTSARPWLNLRLPGDARLAGMWEVTPMPFVTIRRHRHVDITLDGLMRLGMVSPAMSAFLQGAVLARRSILVVGTQSSGKTTLLRALCRCIPDTDRFVTMESEFELLLHELPRPPAGLLAVEEREGLGEIGRDGRAAGEVTIEDLFPHTLRHSMDRCIVGEIRGGEVTAVLKAMTRGYKGSMATFHAESAEETVTAMAALMSEYRTNWSPEAAQYQIAQAVDLVVFVDRVVLPGGGDFRFVSHIVEINGVSERGRVSQTPIFGPVEEFESVDPRGYPVGRPADQRWMRRVGVDLEWLEPSRGQWPDPFPTSAWR